MKILAVFGRNAYGDPARGEGYEHANILPDLEAIAAPGDVRLFDSWDRPAYEDFAALNVALVAQVAAFQPDIVFLIVFTHEIWTETLDLIRAKSPAALVHWGTDDSWKYRQATRFIAPHVDLHITTDAAAAARAKRDGLDNVVQSQWAACATKLRPPLASRECRYDVSFLGAKYGNRPAWIEALGQRGIKVDCFGRGWDGGVVVAEEIPVIFQQSRLSLNFSDSGLQLIGGRIQRSRQIKARTFEVPGSGGMLLTEPADGLERYFDTQREIATFANANELAQKIRYFLANPSQRDAVAVRAHERTAREHTYRARLPDLFAQAQRRAKAARPNQSWQLEPAQLDEASRRHACGPVLKAAATVLDRIARLALGANGPKSARRLVHELSWRIAGARTYSAAGLPGRLFYS